jgi:HD-GYP domain-containing protein (c-di-GMP phosphodiesterase class II)
MKVKPNQLKKGCILLKDVQGLTDLPIIRKNTVLTEEHIELLKVFLIESVEVGSLLTSGETFKPIMLNEDTIETPQEQEAGKDFLRQYLETVKQYKQLFLNWQAGEKVNVVKVREMFIPLFERIIKEPGNLLKLHHYSNKEDYFYHHSVFVGILSVYSWL